MAERKLTAEDFNLDSGLFDGGPAAIVDACFEPNPNPKYRAESNTPGLSLTLESPDVENEFNQWCSIGEKKDWRVQDKGERVASRDNPDSIVFNMNSRAGHVITGMLKAIGGGDINKGKQVVADRGYPMTDANFYRGWNFDWKQVTQEYKIEGRDVRSKFVVPVTLINSPDDTGKSKTKTKGRKSDEVEAHELDDVLVDLAKGGLSELKLKRAALNDDDIKANDEYMHSLVNGTRIPFLVDSGRLERDKDGILTPSE